MHNTISPPLTAKCEAPRACLPQAGTARGFPAMIYYLILCPFLPAGRQGLRPQGGACGARSGQSDREMGLICAPTALDRCFGSNRIWQPPTPALMEIKGNFKALSSK